MTENELFEKNEKLVYLYLNRKHIDMNERDDILQQLRIGLFKAIRAFDKNRGLQFSTLAMRCIDNEYKQYLRKKSAVRRKGETCSIHNNIKCEDDEIEYIHTLRGSINVEDEVILKEALDRLNEKERKLLTLFQTMIQVDIAKEMGHTQKHISQLKQRLIEKITG